MMVFLALIFYLTISAAANPINIEPNDERLEENGYDFGAEDYPFEQHLQYGDYYTPTGDYTSVDYPCEEGYISEYYYQSQISEYQSGIRIINFDHIINGMINIYLSGDPSELVASIDIDYISEVRLPHGRYVVRINGRNIRDQTDYVIYIPYADFYEVNLLNVQATAGYLLLFFNVVPRMLIINDIRYADMLNPIFLTFGEHFIEVVAPRDYKDFETVLNFQYDGQTEEITLQQIETASDRSILLVIFLGSAFSVLIALMVFILTRIINRRNNFSNTMLKINSRKLNSPIIEARNLKTKRYKNNESMDFNIYKGDIVFIIGQSGSGKTTLIKMLGGLDKSSDKNTLNFTAIDDTLQRYNWKNHDAYLKGFVGYVSQVDALYDDLNVDQLLSCYRQIFNVTRDSDELLSSFGLESKRNEKIKSLSGGERKRLSIVVQLLRCSSILLLDEPDSGLDPENRELLYSLLDREARDNNTTIVISTHHQDILKSYFCAAEKIKEFNNNRGVELYRRENYDECFQLDSRNSVDRTKPLFFRECRLIINSFIKLIPVAFLCMFFLWLATSRETFNAYDNALPIVFAKACAAILLGLITSINLVCNNFAIIKQEMRMGIHAKSLIGYKIAVITPICLVMSGILTLPYFLDIWSIPEQSPVFLFISIFVVMLTSSAIGLLISTIAKDRSQNAVIAVPFVMLFQILFSGFIFEQIRVDLLHYISISRYAIRTMGSAVGFDREAIRWDTPALAFENSFSHIFQNLAILIIFFALATIFSIVLLDRFDKKGEQK